MEQKRAAVLRRTAFTLAVAAVFLYFLLWQLNCYLAENLKQGLYLFFAPVLICGALYFCGLRKGLEIKLLAAYMVWIVLTRVLNGDRVLQKEYLFVLDLALMLPMTLLGLTLDGAGRRRFLDGLSAFLGLFYLALGCLCLYTFLSRRTIVNPISGGFLSSVDYNSPFPRISALDTNTNTVAYWFMIPLMLLIYQFFARKNRWWRVPIVLCCLVYMLVISVTYCRTVYAATGAAFAFLVFLLLRKKCRTANKALLALLLAACLLLVTPLCYFGYALAGDGIEAAAEKLEAENAPVTEDGEGETPDASPESLRLVVGEGEIAPTELSAQRTESETLDKISSGRLSIYRATLESIRRQPRILLFGSAAADVVEATNEVLAESDEKPVVQLHNFPLQTLVLSGLPGVLLVGLFCVLTLLRFLRLCFCADVGDSFAELTLGLPVVSCLLCGLAESGYFNYTDARTLFFYLICGLFLGTAYERRAAER